MKKILGLIVLIGAIVGAYFYLDLTPNAIITDGALANKAIPLTSGEVLEQNIDTAGLSAIKEIQIQFGTYKRTNAGTITVALFENENEVAHWEIPMESLIDNTFQSFKLGNAVKINKSAHYVLKISETYEGQNVVAVWSNDSTDGEYEINNEVKTGTICYKLIGK